MRSSVARLTSYTGTNTQHELLKTSDTTTDSRMSNLRLIWRNDHDQKPNTKTSDGSTRVEVADVTSASLECSTETEDGSTDEDGHTTAEFVASKTSKASTEESAAGEERYHSATACVSEKVGSRMEGIIHFILGWMVQSLEECLGGNHTSDDTEIVPVKERPKGGKDAYEKLINLSK